MTQTSTQTLTVADLTALYMHDEWLGYGYLGERSTHLNSTDPEAPAQPALVAATDAAIIEHANAHGWTRDQLLAWANSKHGRWTGDTAFGGGTFADAVRFGYLSLPTD